MGLNLKKLGQTLWEAITPQNEGAQRIAQANLDRANAKVQAGVGFKYGPLANPAQRQQFVQNNQAPKFNLPRASVSAFTDAITQPQRWDNLRVNVGNFKGSGLVEDFVNSPFKIGGGAVRVGQKDFKRGVGEMLTGAVEGPLGLIPITRGAGAASKATGLLPKVTAAAKTGLIEGAVPGAAYGAGGAMEQGKDTLGIIKDAAVGGVVGGVGSAAVSGALPVVTAAVRNRVPLNEVGSIPAPKGQRPKVTAKTELPKPLPTVVAKNPNAAQKAFTSVRGELSRQGTGGAEIANRLQRWRARSEIGQQSFLNSIPTVTGLKKKEFPDFVAALDALSRGETPNMSPKVAQAVKEWSTNIQSVQRAAVAAGLEVGDRGPFYFPRRYSKLLKTRNGFNVAVNHLVQTGQAESAAEAIQQLRFIQSGRNFGNFKAREFDIPGYDTSQDIVSSYVGGAFDDISKAEQFGPKNEVANQLLARIGEEGYDTQRATRGLDIALGNVDRTTPGHKISSGIRKFNAIRSLSTAGVSNATQLPVNTGTIAGFGRTLKGIVTSATSKEARAKAKETGVLLDDALQRMANQALGTGGKITRNIASPFFKQIEKFNRQTTAIVGADWGNTLARKAAKGDQNALRILQEKLGVEGKIGAKLTRDQEIQAARGLVEKAQFRVDPQDLPGWVDSPMGKLVAQFRTFGYKQSNFMYNEVLKEALKGNFAPITRFVAVAVPAGAGAQYVKSKIKGTEYTEEGESLPSQGVKAVAAVGGFGLPGSEGQNIYKSAQYDNLTGAIAGTMGGPTASLIAETAENTNKAIKGNARPIAKQAVRSIPSFGPSIANRAFPKKEYTQPDKSGSTGTPKQQKNNADAEIQALKDKANEGYGLEKLSDGRYAYTIDDEVKTSKDFGQAQMAIAKDAFKKSDKSILVRGDLVLRKGKNGDVSTMSKLSYDSSLLTNKLQSAKKKEDYKGWQQIAEQQYANLQEQLLDPTLDDLEKSNIQEKIDNLIADAEKFKKYGGFKKPKSGRKKSGVAGGNAGSAYKYAVSSNSGGGVARPRVTARGKTATAKRRSSGGQPRVALRKSTV